MTNSLHANEIVSSVKSYREFIGKYFRYDNIDFMGCSEYYCEEKINALITELQYLKKHLKHVEKTQRILAKETRPTQKL